MNIFYMQRQICEALSLDPNSVRKVTLTIEVSCAPLVTVESWVKDVDVDNLVPLLETYRLVPQTDEPSQGGAV